MAEKYDDAKPMHQWMKDLFAIVKLVNVKYPLDTFRNTTGVYLQWTKSTMEDPLVVFRNVLRTTRT